MGARIEGWQKGVWQIITVTACMLTSAIDALATEGGFIAGPTGGSDIRAALIGPPGFYVGGYAGGFVTDGFRNDDGGIRIPGAKASAPIGGIFFQKVWDWDVLGGRVASGIAFGASHLCVHIVAPGNQCRLGLADSYVDYAVWSRHIGAFDERSRDSGGAGQPSLPYGLTIGIGLAGMLPIGTYEAKPSHPDTGSNTWVLIPNIAITYQTRPWLLDGTEFSARLFYNIHFENPVTRYQAGDLLVLDWAVTERNGRWQFGPSGSFATQLGDDRQFGSKVLPRGNLNQTIALGAVAQVDFPESRWTFGIKALTDVSGTNKFNLDRLIVRAGYAFP